MKDQTIETKAKNKVINEVAKNVLNLKTLEIRKSDELDFHEYSVWSIKEALELAYEKGLELGRNPFFNAGC
jgi:hypothetical protein